MAVPVHRRSLDVPSAQTFRYTDIDDDNALVTSIASAVTQQVYSAATLDGAYANPGPALCKMQQLTVSTAANAATYNLVAITAVGTDQNGQARTVTATLTAAGGGEVLSFTDSDGNAVGMLSVTSITVPAMLGVGGAFEFGVADVIFDTTNLAKRVRGGAGDINIQNDDAVVTLLTCINGEHHDVSVRQILDATTTAFPIISYH